jgi:hypothetical protein
MQAISMLKQDRALTGRVIDGLTDDQLRYVPPGFRNNILWNLGHIIVTQQLLHYRLAGQELCVSASLVAQCRNGTSPADWDAPPEVAYLKDLLFSLPERLEEDYRQGRLETFQAYTTSTGVSLEDIDDALHFNLFHEGMHTGVIASIKKLVLHHRV